MKEPLTEPDTTQVAFSVVVTQAVENENETKLTLVNLANDQTDQDSDVAVLPANSSESTADDRDRLMSEDALWSDDALFDIFDTYDSQSTGDEDDDEEYVDGDEEYIDSDDDEEDGYYVPKVIDLDYYGYSRDDEEGIEFDLGGAQRPAKMDGYDYIVDEATNQQELMSDDVGNGQLSQAHVIDSFDEKENPKSQSWRRAYWGEDYGEDEEESNSEVGDSDPDAASEADPLKDAMKADEGQDGYEASVEGKVVAQVKKLPEIEFDSPSSQRADDADDEYPVQEDYGYETDLADESDKFGEEIESIAW